MKRFTRKVVGKGRMALIVSLLVIGFLVGTNLIQPDPVARAAVSVVSNQHTNHDQSTGNIHSLIIGFADQGMLPHLESNSNHSTPGEQQMSTPPGNTMPGMDMSNMNMPGTDSGHNQPSSLMGISLDAKTIVLGSFVVFNGLILIIAAFLKRNHSQRKRTNIHRKTNQYIRPKESVV